MSSEREATTEAAAKAQAEAVTKAQPKADTRATVNLAGGGVPGTTNLEQPEIQMGENGTLPRAAGADQSVPE